MNEQSIIKFRLWYDDKKECILRQYTGIGDRNGKEIYCYDIVRLTADIFGHKYDEYCEIVFYDGAFCLKRKGEEVGMIPLWMIIRSMEGMEMEVVGNVYENPELRVK